MNTLAIVGFGNIARRAVPMLAPHFAITALVRPERMADAVQFPSIRFAAGDLDDLASLASLRSGASHIVHLAPPPNAGTADPRTGNLLATLAATPSLPERIVYISTSGVYGNCDGAWVDEDRPLNPQSDRARRRVDAERKVSAFGLTHGVRTIILRVPGIYAADRLPVERVRRATPVLRAEDDVYTNHVHADDLAAIILAALIHPHADGIYNACDDSALAMGDWFDLIADRARLPRPPRIPLAQAPRHIPPALLSFMRESRRLVNTRMKQHLGVGLRYPTVVEGVPASIDPPA